mmetsp:Transcript_9622/g.23881  ORF Transcript_9622/g.23881 Transcript_9622/m.23881 type:complete len:232 (-) Transcript_9622:1554-2249(-)
MPRLPTAAGIIRGRTSAEHAQERSLPQPLPRSQPHLIGASCRMTAFARPRPRMARASSPTRKRSSRPAGGLLLGRISGLLLLPLVRHLEDLERRRLRLLLGEDVVVVLLPPHRLPVLRLERPLLLQTRRHARLHCAHSALVARRRLHLEPALEEQHALLLLRRLLEVRLRLLEDRRRAVSRLLRLELGEGDPHLDVLGAVEQRAVQRAGALRLALRDLEVDVRLPQSLRHV